MVHLLGTEFRFDRGQALLARVVAKGDIGRPRMATWIMHVPVLADPAAVVPAWWAEAALTRRVVVGARLAADRPDPGHRWANSPG